MRRQGRRRKQLPDELKEIRGFSKWKSGSTTSQSCRTRFERGHGPVVRRSAEGIMN